MNVSFVCAAASAIGAVALATAPVAACGARGGLPHQHRQRGHRVGGASGHLGRPRHRPCRVHRLEQRRHFADEVADLVGVTDWTDYQAGVFIGAVTGAFCPQFENKIG